MNELRIYFVDLIAFVPAADGSHWILLPEARQPSVASDGVTRIDPHHPIVLFDLTNQGGSDWQTIHCLLNLAAPPGDREAWLLDRQELRIAISPALPVGTPGSAATGLPTPANRTDFTWIPNLASLGLPAQVDPDCLIPAGTTDHAPSTKIAARLHLETGTLTSFQFVKRPLPLSPQQIRIPRLELKPLGGGTPSSPLRACTDVAVATLRFTGPSIEVAAVHLDTEKPVPGRTIHLTPTGNVVNLLVGNLSPDPPAGPVPSYGVHFERYYDLLSSPPAQRPIPHIDGGFPSDPASHVSATGINGILPTFIREAFQVPFSGFNGPICSLVTLQS